MKTFYCVTTVIFDNGQRISKVSDKLEADKKPENTYATTGRQGIHSDWFDSIEDARLWANRGDETMSLTHDDWKRILLRQQERVESWERMADGNPMYKIFLQEELELLEKIREELSKCKQ